jgi:hypothetical protein
MGGGNNEKCGDDNPPFEDNRHRPFLLVELEAEQVRLRLEQSPFALVLPFVQPCAQIDMPQNAGGRRKHGWYSRCRHAVRVTGPVAGVQGRSFAPAAHPGAVERLLTAIPDRRVRAQTRLQRPQRRLEHRQPGVAAVCRRDDQPGGVGHIGARPQVLDDVAHGVVVLVLPAVLVRDLPGGERIALKAAEALIRARDVQPEREDDRPTSNTTGMRASISASSIVNRRVCSAGARRLPSCLVMR